MVCVSVTGYVQCVDVAWCVSVSLAVCSMWMWHGVCECHWLHAVWVYHGVCQSHWLRAVWVYHGMRVSHWLLVSLADCSVGVA